MPTNQYLININIQMNLIKTNDGVIYIASARYDWNDWVNYNNVEQKYCEAKLN